MDLPTPPARICGIRTSSLIAVALAAVVLTPAAGADGQPVVGVEASGLDGQNVRYEALPYEGDTFVQRIRPSTGESLGSRVLRGEFRIPVVAQDGTAGGLTIDRQTLVLIGPRGAAKTILAVLDAPTLKVRKTLTLRGNYAFDALSPHGRWLFLVHYTPSRSDPLAYEVVSLDLRTGRLDSRPIVDPREPDEKMNGHPVTRATSTDGRWAYTLYKGRHHPFVHALDTVRRDARCIDLDWLHGRKDLWQLRFALREDGRKLTVRQPGRDSVAVVDTRTFEASRPSAAGVGSWPTAGLSALAFLGIVGALLYLIRTRSRSAFS
jgi:hypothetical protein